MEKLLIVGGTGLTGAHAALNLDSSRYEVTLASRQRPAAPALSRFTHMELDYTDPGLEPDLFAPFDAVVFAAGADIRKLPPDTDESGFYYRQNVEAIPRLFEMFRDAGVGTVVNIGSYYPQVVPHAIETSDYVRSRYLSDEAIRAMSSERFRVCSLNAPPIVGYVPGVDLRHLATIVDYARGRLDGVPLIAPAGGLNHMASASVTDAIAGALEHGTGGRGYLIGDENLSWKAYLELYFEAAGNPQDLPVTEEEHPLFPDAYMYAGRNAWVSYEPENGELGYRRHQVEPAIRELVAAMK